MSKNFYAVKNGRNPGIYATWAECERQVKGFKEAKFKKFTSHEEAVNFIEGGNGRYTLENLPSGKEPLMEIDDIKEDEAIAYVDGSYSKSTKTFSYGMVFFTTDGKEDHSGKDDDNDLATMRNVAGELSGAIEAMKLSISKGKKRLYLHYDYMGIEEWAKGNWKTNKEGTRAYKEYYDSIRDKLDVVFIKVLAHSGVKYNEEADLLAKKELS